MPGEFVFFGTGWNKYRHLGYGGVVNDKFSTYHGYKFALCLENTKGMRDYVTEKIFDCLCSGIVPIYGGAPNIKEYVPKECFIDYFDFNNLDELKQFIIEMDRDTYHRYLEAGKKLVCGRIQQQYTKAKYAECIYEAIKTKVEFEITLRGKIIAKCRLFCQLCKELM